MQRSRRHRPGYVYVVPLLEEELQGRWAHAVKEDQIGTAAKALCGNAPKNDARWIRRMPLGAHRCPACLSLFNQIVGSAGNKVAGGKTLREEKRPLRELGAEVRQTWKPTRREALEKALRVIENTDKLEDTHEGMTGLEAVEYFLERHWRCWRGKHTHEVKRELEALVRLGHRRKSA